jgi:hypothetical protein
LTRAHPTDRADLSALARRLLTAFSWADLDSMRAMLRFPPIAHDQVTKWWMVEGQPAESDRFSF